MTDEPRYTDGTPISVTYELRVSAEIGDTLRLAPGGWTNDRVVFEAADPPSMDWFWGRYVSEAALRYFPWSAVREIERKETL